MGKVDKFVDEHSTTIITGGAIAVFGTLICSCILGTKDEMANRRKRYELLEQAAYKQIDKLETVIRQES